MRMFGLPAYEVPQFAQAQRTDKPICYHPSGEITVIKEYSVSDEPGSEKYGEVKCEACHKIFNAEKTVEKVKINTKPKIPGDFVEVQYVEKVYWTEINYNKCNHPNITVSKSSVTDYEPFGRQSKLLNPNEKWQYATAHCKRCLNRNLIVRSRYDLVYRGGLIVKEKRSNWSFY